VVFCTCPLCVIVLLCFSFATFIRCTADMMLPLLNASREAEDRAGPVSGACLFVCGDSVPFQSLELHSSGIT